MFVDEMSYEILSASRIFHINALKEYLHSCINTFAASYLNTQGLNNSCLKSRQRRP